MAGSRWTMTSSMHRVDRGEEIVGNCNTHADSAPRVVAIGYEDVNDHDERRYDPVLALFAEKLELKRPDCAPLAGKSMLNRIEHAPLPRPRARPGTAAPAASDFPWRTLDSWSRARRVVGKAEHLAKGPIRASS
jgi:hypothetical protein